jgi:predicted PurR-regulated permease PerM
MAGPTPVSALIHAATMVTAGVYLTARMSGIYMMAPEASQVIAVVGVLTAFFAATVALVQTDIKKVLAYSTVSQLGFMFLALGVGAYGVAIFHVFTYFTVTPVVCFYLLRDWPRMLARIDSWLPRRSAATIREIASETDRVLSAWLRGQLLCCALLAVYYAVALSAIRLELGLTVGLMAGILSFIPYIGSITGLITALALALAQFGSWHGVVLVACIFLVGQLVEGYLIYPRLLGDRVELHAVWVIFALFAGGIAFGFLGVLLAVPMAAALGVVARFWLRRYLESPLYLDPPRTGR